MNRYLGSVRKQIEYYKSLGEKTFEQLPEQSLFWKPNAESNSIATIVKHLHGNMMSRWTDFRTTDGEKEWRSRDEEFVQHIKNKVELLSLWDEGWHCFITAIDSMEEEDLDATIYIRNMGHTILEAINRQLTHYPYHIGQIVYIGKLVIDKKWQSLSIDKGASSQYNQEKFSQPQRIIHFTDDL